MMTTAAPRNIDYQILSPDGLRRIHEASLRLIAEVGMRVGGQRALERLQDHGATMTADGRLRLPVALVEQAIETAPKRLVLYTRDGQPAMTIDSRNPVHFGTHADQLQFLDPTSGQARDFLKADTSLMCKLADALPNIDFILSVGMSKDIRPQVQTQVSFLETLRHFGKTINFSTNDIDSLEAVIEMAALVAGGRDQLAEKPFIFNYCEPIPPLTHPVESTEKLWVSAENRIPVVYMPYCMMGGTAPMSFAATLAQCNAEVLVGLTLTQLVTPGTPLIYGAMPSIMDMKTTIGSYGAAEFHLLVAAASELADHYGLPFYGTAGCTDANTLDEQAVSEATMEIFSTLLSKANLVHDVGVADHCNSVSPELLVLADEIIESLKHYTQGVAVNDDTLALEVIEAVGPGGAYLNAPHTLQHFRDIHYPTLFSRKMANPERSEVRAKIRDRIAQIQAQHQVAPLDPKVFAELARYEERHLLA